MANDNVLRSNINIGYTKLLLKNKTKKPAFSVGDFVRVANKKTRFSRGYSEQFGRQLYIVTEIKRDKPVITYKVRNADTNLLLNENLYASNLTLFKDR